MKILILSYMYPNARFPTLGTFVKAQAELLSKHCEVTVVSPSPWLPETHYGIPKKEINNSIPIYHPKYFPLPGQFLFALKSYIIYHSIKNVVKKIKKDYDFDIIHAHFAFPDGYVGYLLKKYFRRPLVITVHGSDVYSLNDQFATKLAKKALFNCDKVITVSHALQGRVKKFVPKEKVLFVPNEVDTQKFFDMDTMGVRRKLGLNENMKIVVFVGNLITVKGLSYLIEAVKIVKERRNDFVLLVIGSGESERSLRLRVKRCNVGEKIRFMGVVPHSKIPLWLNAADFLVLPSLSEGRPTVVAEAHACGTPVIATDIEGTREMIDREELGILVPPRDAKALAGAITTALDKNWSAEKILRHGKKDAGVSVKNIINVYNKLKCQ